MSNFRLPPSSRYVTGVLRDHAEALLQKLDRSKSTRDCVENLLVPLLHARELGVAMIADKMGLSRQTLSRKL